MKMRSCKNCGSPSLIRSGYNTYKCPYCDTEYELDGDDLIPITKEIVETNVTTIGARVEISREAMIFGDPKCIQNYVIEELTKSLARELLKCAEIQDYPNVMNCSHDIYARVKVVDGKRHLELRDAISSILNNKRC